MGERLTVRVRAALLMVLASAAVSLQVARADTAHLSGGREDIRGTALAAASSAVLRDARAAQLPRPERADAAADLSPRSAAVLGRGWSAPAGPSLGSPPRSGDAVAARAPPVSPAAS